ncbi:MAG: ankyrin repeat domain-containing protein [Myxococcota bacterium]
MTRKRLGGWFVVLLFGLPSWSMNKDDGRRPEKGLEQSENPLGLSESKEDFEEWWGACYEGDETLIGVMLNELDPSERMSLINQQMDASHDGLTCLMLAAVEGRTPAARFLLQHGANVMLKSTDGKTALDYAVEERRNEIIQAILVRIITDSWR